MNIKQQARDMLKRYPTLGYPGFGYESQEERQKLLESLDQVEHVITWLRDKNVEKRKSINPNHSSYAYKHLCEKTEPQFGYISNGAFILGALLSGFSIEIQGINAFFNISDKSINRIVKEDFDGVW